MRYNMHANNSILVGLIIVISLLDVRADDSQCTINGRKAAHVVDERFISVSIDPAFLFSGIKISSVAVNLAKNLAPAFVRFSGPSTPFLKFGDDSKAISRITQGSKSLVFGPTMWWSLNAWIKQTNLTPVFALNEHKANWNTKSSLNLLDLTAKLDVECYWQLGYDCTGKSEEQYIQDLKNLRNALNEFPSMKRRWKIVGSDLSTCSSSEISRKFMEDLDVADAIMWEPGTEIFNEDPMNRFLGYYQPTTPVWTSAPKVEHPIAFSDGIYWGIHLGETARNGFDVVFRQPRFQELFSDTPVYWVSLLHKRLMGRNVLDVKTSSLSTSDTYIYAHCSKNQNSYSIRGAMTIMVINNGTAEHTTAMKVAGTQLKNVDVRSYILTSNKINSLDTYLNGEKLSMENLTEPDVALVPKLRRAKAITHLTLAVPPKSVGFFVLPGARIPVCISDEDETDSILEEMHRDQNIDFTDIFSGELSSRMSPRKDPSSLDDLYRMLEREFEQDERFYRKMKKAPFINEDSRKAPTETKSRNVVDEAKSRNVDAKSFMNEASVKRLLEKSRFDFKNLLGSVDAEKKVDDRGKAKLDVDVSSAEILRLLADRAKAKMEKKVGLANTDFDDLFEKTFRNKIRSKRNVLSKHQTHDTGILPVHAILETDILSKYPDSKDTLSKGEVPAINTVPAIERADNRALSEAVGEMNKKRKRDINMSLLDEKSGKKTFFRGLQKEATIRRPGESSVEYLGDAFAPAKAETRPANIFAGLASQEDAILAPPGLPMKSTKDAFSSAFALPKPKKDFFGLEMPKLAIPGLFAAKPASTTSKSVGRKTFVGYVKDDEDANDADLENLGDELDAYHGFHEIFGDDVTIAKPRQLKGNRELWEFADIASDKDHPGDLLHTEFIINNADDKGEIDKTLQRLENFFNKPSDQDDYESTLSRFRRELRGSKSGRPDEKKYERQIKFLKSRLARHRAELNERRRRRGHAKRLHHPGRRWGLNRRHVRSAKNTYDISYDDVPRVKQLASKLEKVDWKEITGLPAVIDKRHRRRAIWDMNAIDDSVNNVRGNGGFIKPSSNEQSGEYAIILPTRDSIALERKNGDVKLKIHQNMIDSQTCLATDFTSADFTTPSPQIISINDHPNVPKLSSDNDVKVTDLSLNSTAQMETNNPQTKSNNPQANSNNVKTISNNAHTNSNNAQTIFNNASPISNNAQMNSNNAETNSSIAQTNSTMSSNDYEFSVKKVVSSMNFLAKDVFNKIKSIFN